MYMHTHSIPMCNITTYALHYRYAYIPLQDIPLQEATTGAQQSSIQHQTVVNNDDDTQLSSAQHQPMPQYALPDKGTASNKDKKVATLHIITKFFYN